jgi:hypothetical protein
MTDFKKSLEVGKTGETEIAKWLLSQGHNILPVYEISEGQYKGPAIYSGDETIIAPDMLVFHQTKGVIFVEAKSKTAFSEYRIKSKKGYTHWVTGIDQRHFNEYLKVKEKCNTDIFYCFCKKEGRQKIHLKIARMDYIPVKYRI